MAPLLYFAAVLLARPLDLNRRPTDYESDRNPRGTLSIGHFVRGWLTLADVIGQHFSPLCATNVPRGSSVGDRPNLAALVQGALAACHQHTSHSVSEAGMVKVGLVAVDG